MPYHIEFHPQAVQELEDSYTWYEERSVGLGERFINAVSKRLKLLAATPEIFPKKRKNYREVTVDSFPFTIIYEVFNEEAKVLVYYVFHSKRNPKIKYKR